MRHKSLYENNISSASNFLGFLFDLEWPEIHSDMYRCSLVNSVQYHISSFDGCVILESGHPWMGVLQSSHTLDMRAQKKNERQKETK